MCIALEGIAWDKKASISMHGKKMMKTGANGFKAKRAATFETLVVL